MNKKLTLYVLIFALVGGSAFLIYRLFFQSIPESATPSQDAKSKTPSSGEKSSERKDALYHSIWKDKRMTGKTETRFGRSAAEEKEITEKLADVLDYYKARDDRKFLEKIDQLLEEHPNVPEFVALKGDYLYEQGEYEEAEKLISRLVELNPENEYARTTLGEVAAIQGRYDEAKKRIDEVLERNPGNRDALLGKMAINEMMGQPEKGIEETQKFAEDHPDNPSVQNSVAEMEIVQNKTEAAARRTEQVLKNNPTDSWAHRNAAVIAMATNDLKKAEMHSLKAYEYAQNAQEKAQAGEMVVQILASQNRTQDLKDFQARRAQEEGSQ